MRSMLQDTLEPQSSAEKKMKKPKRDYRKIKDHNGKTGRGRKEWIFFEKMDEILGDKPATTPPIIVDTSAEVHCAIQESSEDTEEVSEESDDTAADLEDILEDEQKENSDPKDLVAHTEKTEKANTKKTEKAITKNTEKADAKKTEKADAKKTEKADTEKTKKELKPHGKRERPTRGETIEKSMYGAVAKMAKLQEESDLRYLEVEEKRLKFEERMLEMEDRRQRENRT